MVATELKRKRAFRKFSYRGIDLDEFPAPLPLPADPVQHWIAGDHLPLPAGDGELRASGPPPWPRSSASPPRSP